MAKLVIKSDNITPFGGLYSIFNRISASGLRETIDSHPGRRSSDTIERSLRSLADDISYESDKYSYKKSDGYFPGIASVGGKQCGLYFSFLRAGWRPLALPSYVFG